MDERDAIGRHVGMAALAYATSQPEPKPKRASSNKVKPATAPKRTTRDLFDHLPPAA
jgi:hypothetical protein